MLPLAAVPATSDVLLAAATKKLDRRPGYRRRGRAHHRRQGPPLSVATPDRPGVALLALAVGAGSLSFSHVNDAGFWLVVGLVMMPLLTVVV